MPSLLPVAAPAGPDPAQVDAALRIIAELPQAPHIDPARVGVWMEAVGLREPERLRWHALRARGVGGSEIGAVISAMEGIYHPFTPGDKIARQKLLLDPPEEPTDDTRRGVYMEDPLRELFRAQMARDFGAKPADDILHAIAEIEVGSGRQRPWQVGNPDDAFWLPNGDFVLADYKAPRPDVLAGYAVFGKPEDYIFQLHHYAMLAMEKGFTPNKLILVSLDYNRWRPAPQEIPLERERIARIDAAGSRFWNEFVCKGRIPEPVERPVGPALEIEPDVLNAIHRIGRKLAMANTCYKQARDDASALAAVLGNRLQLDSPAVAIDHLDLLVKAEVDEPRVKRLLELWGEDIERYRLPAEPNLGKMEARLAQLGENLRDFYDAGPIDPVAVAARLRKGRENPASYLHQTVDVKLTPLRRGERADMLFAVREQAEDAIRDFADQPNPDPIEVATRAAAQRAEWKAQQKGRRH